MNELSPSTIVNSPWLTRFPSIWDDLFTLDQVDRGGSGLSISEYEKSIYVEASLPGIDPKKVNITLKNGVLSISGQNEEEKKERKYYRKTANRYDYSINLPVEVDDTVEPIAEEDHGIMRVTFSKTTKAQPKKISIKST